MAASKITKEIMELGPEAFNSFKKLLGMGVNPQQAAGVVKSQAQEVARQARATEGGFDPRTFYHSTTTPDIKEIDLSKGDIGFHMGSQEQARNRLKDKQSNYADLGRHVTGYNEGSNIMPLRAALGKTLELPDVMWENSFELAQNLMDNPAFRNNTAVQAVYEEMGTRLMFEDVPKFLKSKQNKAALKDLRQAVIDEGYDSIKYLNEVENKYGKFAGLTPEGEARKADLTKQINRINNAIADRPNPLLEEAFNAPTEEQRQAALQRFLNKESVSNATPEETAKLKQLQEELSVIEKDPKFSNDPYSYIALKPEKVRSAFAQFKDLNSKDLMKSVGGLGVAITLGGQTEDAEAGVLNLSGFADDVGRLIQTGLLKAESANSPRAIQTAANKYNKLLKESPGFARREDIAAMNDAVTKRTINTYKDQAKVYTPEDLVKMDTAVTPVKGDPSFIGEVTQVAGVPTSKAQKVEGGFQYPFANVEGWQSMFGAAKPFHDKMKKIADVTGKQPVAIYSGMGPDSSNFSSPPATIMLDQIQNILKPDDSSIKLFDQQMKQAYNDWPGLMSPSANAWLNGGENFIHEGKRRTYFTKLAEKPVFRDAGFPVYREVIDAVNHPLLSGNELGTSGASLFFPDVNRDIFKDVGRHTSYDWVIPQRQDMPPGRLEVPVGFENVYNQTFPEVAKEWTNPQPNKQRPKGSVFEVRPYKRDEAVDAIAKRSAGDTPATLGYQVANEQWGENLNKAIEAEKKRRAALGAAGLSTVASTGALAETGTPMEPDYGTIKAPDNPLVDKAYGMLSGLNNQLSGDLGSLLQFPGLETVLRKLGYNDENLTYGDAFGAGLELMGILPVAKAEKKIGEFLSNEAKDFADFAANAVSQKTQRANTVATAVKANDYLDAISAPKGKTLDYGAGLGENAKAIKADATFEPFPQKGFEPTYTNPAEVPANSFERVVSTNVINVLPKNLRDDALLNIGKSLKKGGTALVQTWDLGAIKATSKSKTAKPVPDEQNAYITGTGTFQKGFSGPELKSYAEELLGDLYTVEIVPNKANLSGVAITITKK